MARIVVGAQTKHLGKTTLITNIMQSFPEVPWAAAKFSSHDHHPQGCSLLRSDTRWRIWEQATPTADSDTGRFLLSGARRALLIEYEPGSLSGACESVVQELSEVRNLIVESAAASKYLRPDLFLMILDPENADFNAAARAQLATADVVLVRNEKYASLQQIAPAGVPVMRLHREELDEALRKMIAARLKGGLG